MASEVILIEACLEGRDVNGIFGMAGTMGTTGTFGRPEGLIFGVTCWGGAAEEGVVGCVDVSSEGGCDVKGVPMLAGTCSVSSVLSGASVELLLWLGELWYIVSTTLSTSVIGS